MLARSTVYSSTCYQEFPIKLPPGFAFYLNILKKFYNKKKVVHSNFTLMVAVQEQIKAVSNSQTSVKSASCRFSFYF